MAPPPQWQDLASVLRRSHDSPGDVLFRFLDRLAAQPRAGSLYPKPDGRGFLVSLTRWERDAAQGHLQIRDHGPGLLRITLVDVADGEPAGHSVDVCSEMAAEDVFADYLLRLRHGDPLATARRLAAGWKGHARGKSREETIAEWEARPGEWGLAQAPRKVQPRQAWLAECASVRFCLGRVDCPGARHLLRFFKPKLSRYEPRWAKRLAEGLVGRPPCAEPAVCVCREAARLLPLSGNADPAPGGLWEALFEERLQRVRYRSGLAAGQREKEQLEQHRREVWRELLGNPFAAEAFEPAWLDCPDVARMARAIDQDNNFSRMPILGDALEEAGCTSAAILGHCRQGGTHLPGCWVVGQMLQRW
jgi:hypothetical protein